MTLITVICAWVSLSKVQMFIAWVPAGMVFFYLMENELTYRWWHQVENYFVRVWAHINRPF